MRAWAAPSSIAAISIAGLVLALLSEGVLDLVALFLVASPLVLLAVRLLRPPAPPNRIES